MSALGGLDSTRSEGQSARVARIVAMACALGLIRRFTLARLKLEDSVRNMRSHFRSHSWPDFCDVLQHHRMSARRLFPQML